MTPRCRPLHAVLPVLAAILIGCGSQGPTTVPASPPAGGPSLPAASASAVVSVTPSTSPGGFDPSAVAIALEATVNGLTSPLAVANAGDGSNRIFVAEQRGSVRVVSDGELVRDPFLKISDRIRSGGERGLLGLAFHPDYPTDPRVFVNYTDLDGNTRVSSFTVDPEDPGRADPDSEVRLVFIEQPYANHNGGALAFGPDGYLYIAAGDGGSGGDPHGNGQSLNTFLGKILRIDVDKEEGDKGYAIPPDNPFVGKAGALPEIFVYGLRNPWRMSFDRATGDLWIGDVGQGAREEIDVVRAGTSGQNFGWNIMEGSHCFRPEEGCDEASLVPPVTDYGRDDGSTVIGGDVYRGTQQPALVGGYVFADFGSGNVWLIDASSDGPTEPVLVAEDAAAVSSFGEDEAGEIYATSLSTGELLHVVAGPR